MMNDKIEKLCDRVMVLTRGGAHWVAAEEYLELEARLADRDATIDNLAQKGTRYITDLEAQLSAIRKELDAPESWPSHLAVRALKIAAKDAEAARAEGYAQGVRDGLDVLRRMGLGQDRIRFAHDAILSLLDATPAPGHTDLMVSPESLDAWLEDNPPPVEPSPEAVARAALEWAASLARDAHKRNQDQVASRAYPSIIDADAIADDILWHAENDHATLAQIIAQAGKGAGE